MKLPDHRYVLSHPDPIEAFQITHATRWNNENWPHWLHKAWNEDNDQNNSLYPEVLDQNVLKLQTRFGVQTVMSGNWIMRHRVQAVDDEFYLVRLHDAMFRIRFKPYIEPLSFWIWLRNWWRTTPW